MSPFVTHGIDHLSASSINLYIAQPALWAAQYLMKRRTPVGPAAHRGTSIEHGVEAGLFDPEMPVEHCEELALAKFHSLTRFSADSRIEKERDTIASSVAHALAELRQYGIPAKADDMRQHKISVMLDGIDVPVIGYLDFRWDQHGIIGDLKSVGRIPTEISDAHCRQGSIYAAAGSNYQVRMMYVSKAKVAVYPVHETERHLASVTRTAKAIERFLSLSDDSEKLTRCLAPDLSSFYWGDASAQSIAREIWG